MFCTNCGKPTEGDEILCPQCKAAQENASAEIPVVEEAPAFTVAPTEPAPTKKKKKLGLTLGIIAGVLVALGIATFFLWDWIASFFNRTVLPPEEYLEKTSTNSVENTADQLADLYGVLLNTQITPSDSGAVGTQLVIGKDLLNMVTPYLPEGIGDLDWLSKIDLDVDYAIKDDAMKASLGIGLGGTRLATAEAVIDTKAGVAYLTIPELNKTPLKVKIDTQDIETALSSSQMTQQLLNAVLKSLPDKDTFRQLIVDYMTLAIEKFDQVEKTQTQLMVGSQNLNVTALTATIGPDDVLNAVEAILTKAQNDPVIIGVLSNLETNLKAVSADVEVDGLQSGYTAAIAGALEGIQAAQEDLDLTQSAQFVTYLDHQDRVVGRKLSLSDAGVATELFHYYTAYTTGDNYNYELVVPATMGVSAIRLDGAYTKQNDVETVTCAVSVDGTNYLNLSINAQGENAGSLRIQPTKALVDMLTESADLELPTALLSDFALELRYNGNTVEFDIRSGDASLLMLKLTAKEGQNNVTIPSGAIDPEEDPMAILQWVSEIDYEGFFQKLKDAGVPEALVDAVTNALMGSMGPTDSMIEQAMPN